MKPNENNLSPHRNESDRTPKQQRVDVLKNEIAKTNGFELRRFIINDVNDVNRFKETYGKS